MVSLILFILEKDSDHPPPKALAFLLFASADAEVFLGLLAIIALLGLSAIFAASRVALFSLTPQDIAKLSEQKDVRSRRVLALRRMPRQVRAMLLLCSNAALVAFIVLANYLLKYFFTDALITLPSDELAKAVHVAQQSVRLDWLDALHLSMTAAVIASSVVIFNASAPKWYVPRNKLQFLRWMSSPLLVLMKVLHPLHTLLLNTTKLMEKRWAWTSAQKRLNGKEDLEEALELSGNTGNTDKNNTEPDAAMLKSILKFSDVTVRQIMTPRMDVVAIDEHSSYADLLEIVQESGYSRIPVYEDDFDNIRGILYVKDLLKHIQEGPDFDWRILVRPNVLYVPEAKKINELLREFQKQRLHMAIVVDEYGGSAGIVTLEDVLEEIIGDIRDEFDDEAEVQYRQLDENTYSFEGKTLLRDVYRLTGIEAGTFDEVRGEADSLAGLILALQGQLPKKDTELTYQKYHFKIVAVSKRRIEQVQLTIEPNAVEEKSRASLV